MQGSGFRVQGSGFRVQGSGFRVQGSGYRIQGAGCRVHGSRFMVLGSGIGIWGLELGGIARLDPVVPSFRALSGRLKFMVRRHKFNKDSLACVQRRRPGKVQT